jgi:hypothetical protein
MKKIIFLMTMSLGMIFPTKAQNIPSYVPSNGLVGWWPFNGNANDESGNGNNGTVNGATLTSDRNGSTNAAYNFTNSLNVINIPHSSSLNLSGAMSFSFWLNSTDVNAHQVIMNKATGGTSNSYILQLSPGNDTKNKIWLNCGGLTQISQLSNPVITANNQWYHVTVVYDLQKVSFYINGQLTNTYSPLTSSTPTNTNPLTIGRDGDASNSTSFKGKLDDIAIYNRALTQEEVTSLYSGSTTSNVPAYVPSNGLVGWWPFNGNANDESGNGYNGTVNGATLTTDRNGNANKAYSFNGNNISFNILNLNKLSISLWFNAGLNQSTSYPTIFDYNSTKFACGIINYPSWANQKNLRYYYTINNSGPNLNVLDNKWHHLVITLDVTAQNFTTYIDGVQSASGKTGESISTWLTSNKLILGKEDNNTAGTTFTGKIDDVLFYNKEISQQEVTALYTGTAQSALSSTKVYVDAPATVNQNDTLELAISTESLNAADNVISFQTDFAYDSTRYTFVSNNVLGTLNTNGNVVVNSTKNGKLNISYMSQTALSGAGSLVKLKFKANDKVGQGIFSMSNFLFNTTNITSLKSDTVNTIDGVPPTAKVTYSVNPARKGDSLLITVKFSEKMAVSPVPQLNLTGVNTLANTNLTKVNDTTYTYWWVVEKGNGAVNVNLATGTDLAGNGIVATPTENASFTVLPTLFGDIDTNNLVQAYDAALALQYSVGLNPLPTMDPLPWSNWRLAVANVDTVGSVTANDASLILQHSAKLITSFPADAKKRGGDAPTANVIVNIENNQLVFRTTGTLYGFNVFFKDNFNAFGQPTVNDKNAIVATNINTNNYNVGLASTTPFAENEPFLVIPIVSTTEVSGTMDVVVNTQEKALSYGRSLGINKETKSLITAYPNPTKDVVTVTNAQGKTLRVLDLQGRVVASQAVVSNNHEVSLKSIGAKGTYILHIVDGNGVSIKENKIVLE